LSYLFNCSKKHW